MRTRSIGLICAALLLTACGGGQRQDAHEPSGKFAVQVTTASFPSSQRLSEHAHLVLAVHNVSGKTLPDVAVTICNVTCAYPAPRGQGTSAAAFGENLQMQGLAHPSRPIWVVDNPPGRCNTGCSANSSSGGGGPGGAVTAYANTWALGQLRPGHTAKFDFGVTAVKPGRHIVAWEVAAGLNGKAKAVLRNGSPPHGTFTVVIHNAPAQTYVNNNGQIVTSSQNNPQ
ncbi:MAG TPA: hypothetical protein VE127_02345 [Solirubrobacteraceae bacterium]|nr:hypothetical protein [Solirubrobacteraceae bacterium]